MCGHNNSPFHDLLPNLDPLPPDYTQTPIIQIWISFERHTALAPPVPGECYALVLNIAPTLILRHSQRADGLIQRYPIVP